MENRNKRLLPLFLTFLKIGAFTFGGGYAMIPLIERETCEKQKWITKEEMLDIVAISESTPGPIAINSATFVGKKTAGFFGALLATLGVVLPSFLIISVISLVLTKVENLKAVKYAFFGIRAGVLALICKALYSMYKGCPKSKFAYIIMALSFVAAAVFNVPVLAVIIISALLGLLWTLYLERGAAK